MLLTSFAFSYNCAFRPRHSARSARPIPRPPCGVLSNNNPSTSQSFAKLHQEVLQDSEWYGPEAPNHAVSPAASAAAPAATATRGDVRLMASFSNFLKSHKLDISVLFCSEAVLSGDSRVVCDPRAGHHTELLSEFLTSGGLRVGEELPHWFVNGNLRGAIKCWMATRPAAAALAQAAAASTMAAAAQQQQRQQQVAQLAASVSEHAPLGAAAAPLVDGLIAAMPVWAPGPVQEMAGWEPAAGVQATAKDVALLHCFGALVYGSRLDVAVFLQQLCRADPFAWAMAQVGQGVILEPEPWLLERFFMSRHCVGEPLPLWFTTWGVRDEISKWLEGPQAAEFVRSLLDTRGLAAAAAAAPTSAATDAAAATTGATAAPSADDARSAALELLESSAPSLLAAFLSRHQGISLTPSLAAAFMSCRRAAILTEPGAADDDDTAAANTADLVATCSIPNHATGLVAIAVQLSYEDGGATAAAAVAAVRQAKERLDWLAFLLRRQGSGGGCSSVNGNTDLGRKSVIAKVVLLLDGEGAAAMAFPRTLVEYLDEAGVLCVRASELPYKGA